MDTEEGKASFWSYISDLEEKETVLESALLSPVGVIKKYHHRALQGMDQLSKENQSSLGTRCAGTIPFRKFPRSLYQIWSNSWCKSQTSKINTNRLCLELWGSVRRTDISTDFWRACRRLIMSNTQKLRVYCCGVIDERRGWGGEQWPWGRGIWVMVLPSLRPTVLTWSPL